MWIFQLRNFPNTETEIIFPHNHKHYHFLLRCYGTNTLLTNFSQNLASQISTLVCCIFNKEELKVDWVRSEVNTKLKCPPEKFSCSQPKVCTWGMTSEVLWTDFSAPIFVTEKIILNCCDFSCVKLWRSKLALWIASAQRWQRWG